MPTTLITGGAGFIGVRLATLLRAAGEDIVLFDRQFDPTVVATLDPTIETVEGNVSHFDEVHRVIATVRPAGIIHLAAILSSQCEIDPLLAFGVNVTGTFNVLEAARRESVGKVVATSSAAALEAAEPVPPLDEDTLLAPLGVYGMTKMVGEEWCQFYHRRFGLDTRVGRPGAVVGPGRVAGGAASAWTTALIEEPLRGHAYVCPVAEEDSSALVYHSDLVKGLAHLYQAPRVPHRIYNLGACSATAGELARLVRERVPGADISFKPDPVARFVVGRWRYVIQNNQRAAEDLGWRAMFATPTALVDACAAEIGQ